MIIFVLHGFASATPNDNSAAMAELYPDANIVNLNYEFDPVVGMDQVHDQIEAAFEKYPLLDFQLLFVGCSLGGFVARYLAWVYGSKAVIMNPAVFPEESLTRFIGANTNYRTGVTFELTEENVRNYANFHVAEGVVPTLVLLDEDDEVIDSAATVKHYTGKASVFMYKGGSHRFEHLRESKSLIDDLLNTVFV